jgi:hypothetical protein
MHWPRRFWAGKYFDYFEAIHEQMQVLQFNLIRPLFRQSDEEAQAWKRCQQVSMVWLNFDRALFFQPVPQARKVAA